MIALYFAVIGGIFYKIFITSPKHTDTIILTKQEKSDIKQNKAAKLHA
ncbi:hypothetical protein [Paucisalibacillus globulus]|nr:hypothetical protein [Paucisalibacillus globulus]